ncbi:MAG: GntR family transcriptional regulator [Turicibacter sp.]|nr:GntR family transcriptional regulator [Turicibacter sp.]
MEKKNQNKYNQIAKEIRQRIFTGTYPLTQPIPDEMSLAKEFSCSRMTMKKALEVLVLEGLLYRKRGHGTFIIKSALKDDKFNIPFDEVDGLTAQSPGKKVTSKILKFNVEFPDGETQERLNVSKETPVYNISRVRYVNDEPFVIENSFYPTTVVSGITEEILHGSLYSYFKDDLQLGFGSTHKEVRACQSDAHDREHLNYSVDSPVLEVTRVAYLNNGIPFEYSKARHHFDRFTFRVVNVTRS